MIPSSVLNRFIYFPTRSYPAVPDNYDLVFEDVHFDTGDGVRLHGWFMPCPTASATFIFCHGNAGNISHRLDNVKLLVETGLQVFIFDYRGYGKSEGTPNEQGLYQDALGAWHWLQDRVETPMVIFGRSLGGAVATWLAVEESVNACALILESTFTRGRDLARSTVPIPGIAGLIPDIFPTIDRVPRVTCPLLLIHGARDKLIPVDHAYQLAATHGSAELHVVADGSHNDTFWIGGDDYRRRLVTFIEEACAADEVDR